MPTTNGRFCKLVATKKMILCLPAENHFLDACCVKDGKGFSSNPQWLQQVHWFLRSQYRCLY